MIRTVFKLENGMKLVNYRSINDFDVMSYEVIEMKVLPGIGEEVIEAIYNEHKMSSVKVPHEFKGHKCTFRLAYAENFIEVGL